jgi:hypothetical protein
LQIYRGSRCRKIRHVPENLGIGLETSQENQKSHRVKMAEVRLAQKKSEMVGNQYEEQNDF